MTDKDYNEFDIAQAWQKMATEKFSNSPIKKQDIMTAIKKESNSSITQLKSGLKGKLYWCAAITIGLIIASFYFLENSDMVVLFGSAIAAYVIGFVFMYQKYREIESDIMNTTDILVSMKSNANLIKSVLKIESIWGTITFMPAVMIGVLFGKVNDGYTLVECFQEPRILATILIIVLIATPIMTWTTGKMNKKAYGENLKKLEDNIIRMETLQ